MKKAYITPALEAVKIETAQVLATSFDKSDETVGGSGDDGPGQLSNKFQGGLLWENDTDE